MRGARVDLHMVDAITDFHIRSTKRVIFECTLRDGRCEYKKEALKKTGKLDSPSTFDDDFDPRFIVTGLTEYHALRVLRHEIQDGQVMLLMQWSGYPAYKSSFETFACVWAIRRGIAIEYCDEKNLEIPYADDVTDPESSDDEPEWEILSDNDDRFDEGRPRQRFIVEYPKKEETFAVTDEVDELKSCKGQQSSVSD
ncbi:unnamed protein product, partial [Fusarium langsethiae]